MEKLEKHIKKTLEERRLEPSAQAWDRIASEIGSKPKKSTHGWTTYAVAASFVGIILISLFFFQKDSPMETIPQVVEEQNTDEVVPIKNDATFPLEIEQNQIEVVKVPVQKQPEQEQIPQEIVFEDSAGKQEIAVEPSLENEILDTSEALIAQKVNEVAEQIAVLETENTEVTDAEVEALLRKAQEEILKEKLFKQPDKVDAMALLAEVEQMESEKPKPLLKERIFEALVKGYNELKTAVADRNQ